MCKKHIFFSARKYEKTGQYTNPLLGRQSLLDSSLLGILVARLRGLRLLGLLLSRLGRSLSRSWGSGIGRRRLSLLGWGCLLLA